MVLYPRVINQYEKGVLFSFGRYSGLLEPGLKILVMFYHSVEIVDMRIKTIEIPKQEVMTKDNVPVNINAVIYFKVTDPEKAILNVKDVVYASSKYAQTAMRNITGQATLDELLSERQKIAERLRELVDVATDPWGISVTAIELQDIELPDSLKRVMAKQAEAERAKRSVIINSEGEVQAAENIALAADKLFSNPGALHLRTLRTISDLGAEKSNTNIWAVPIEFLRTMERLTEMIEKKIKT